MKTQALAQIPETKRADGPIVSLSDVVKLYEAGDVEVSAIKGITFDIPRQRVSMIVRPSGATLGFSDQANLDEAHMWPTAFALKELTAAEEARIGALGKKAVSGIVTSPNSCPRCN